MNAVFEDILGQVYPAAATFLWNFRVVIVFFLALFVAAFVAMWLRSLAPGGGE